MDKARDLTAAELLIPTLGGMTGIIVYFLELEFPLIVGAAVLWVAFIGCIVGVAGRPGKILPRYAIVVYFSAFLASFGYFVLPDTVYWPTPSAIELSTTPEVARIVLLVALVGLCGLTLGCNLGFHTTTKRREVAETPVLGIPAFLFLTLATIIAAALTAPTETIFEGRYALDQSKSTAEQISFSGLVLIVQITFLALALDHTRTQGRERLPKGVALGLALAFYIIVLQFLRGDREATTMLLALGVLYAVKPFSGARVSDLSGKGIARLLALALAVFAAAAFIGMIRSSLSASGEVLVLAEVLGDVFYNSWTATITTVLGAAAIDANGQMELLLGQTYVELAQSLLPGGVYETLGVERPLSGSTGPAWWFMGLSLGGTHVTVVPFMNYGILGVALVLFVYGFFVGSIERLAFNMPSPIWQLSYLSAFAVLPHWFWYGDLYCVRAIMIVAIVSLGIALLSSPSKRPILAR